MQKTKRRHAPEHTPTLKTYRSIICAYFQAFCYKLHYLRLPRIYQKRKLYGLLRPPFSRNQLFVYSERQKRDVAYFYNKGCLYGPTVINFHNVSGLTMCIVFVV